MSRTPQTFFEEEIPAKFAEHKSGLSEDQKAVDMKIGVALSGDGGGEWTIAFGGGDLTVNQGMDDDCDVRMWQSVDHWRETLEGETGISSAGMDFDTFDPSKLKPAIADKVKLINGTLQVEVLDGDEQTFGLIVGFGKNATDSPTCTIQTQEADAAMIREGKMLPQQAFMQGKVKITGDMNLAMQVGSLQMSQ